MRTWDAARVAEAAGALVVRRPADVRNRETPGPVRVTIDSRDVACGELFVGLRGEHVDGGEHAPGALAGGAWGVLVRPELADASLAVGDGAVLTHADPLAALQALARAWRRELVDHGARVVAITGSTGKTSTKDILAALLSARLSTVASPQNLNTEIGLPLAVLAAPAGTQALVLEMAMRGRGQIAELARIAEPDVGVIVNVGPVHLQLLGSLEAIAAAKAELIEEMAAGATIVVPAGEPLLERHLRADLTTVTFGDGGDVVLLRHDASGEVLIGAHERELAMRPSFQQAHNLRNLLAAVAASLALGVDPEPELQVGFSALRGERIELHDEVVVVNDCYNANPMSMRAAIDDLARQASRRRVAVLGDMLELGPDAGLLHREIGAYASARDVQLLVTVGPLAAGMRDAFEGESHSAPDAAAAAELLAGLLSPGDTVLVKGSRGVGLERVAQTLQSQAQSVSHGDRPVAPATGSRRR